MFIMHVGFCIGQCGFNALLGSLCLLLGKVSEAGEK